MDLRKIDMPSAAVTALEMGDPFDAIRVIRAHFGCGLQEALEAMEYFLESNPEVKERYQSSIESRE